MRTNFLKYRPEIDGLRAIAVLSVIVYHAELSGFGYSILGGGYIGVDIFFVISGYLISLIIIKELQKGQFSFREFYERRARRILPALFLVMLVSSPFAWTYMLPETLVKFSGSALSTLFFGSNFWFLFEDSYTAEISALKPFLHTWSLSVEEQFYIVFPIILIVIWKVANRYLSIILSAGLVVSLIFAQKYSASNPDLAFYLLPARGWELLAGGILASRELKYDRVIASPYAKYLPIVGLVLIAGAMILFDHNTQHPSLITAFPVVGTMLVIWFANKETLITRFLGSKILAGVGLISYPLYLWHFPLFAFARIKNGELGVFDKLVLIIAAFLLAYLTYVLVEKYIRNKQWIGVNHFVMLSVFVFIVLLLINAANVYSRGAPSRLGAVADLIEQSKTIQVMQNGKKCHDRKFDEHCVFDVEGAKYDVWLVGDSHSEVLADEVLRFANENNFGYRQITLGGCLHFENVTRYLKNGDYCGVQAIRSKKLQLLVRKDKRKKIIIWSARIVAQLEGEFDNQEGGVERWPVKFMPLVPTRTARSSNISTLIQNSIREWLDLGNVVVLIYPVPEVGWNVAKELKKRLKDKSVRTVLDTLAVLKNFKLSTKYSLYKERSRTAIEILDGVQHKNLYRVFPDKLFCHEESSRCQTHDESALYYRDNNHVSPKGAKLIIDAMKNTLFKGTVIQTEFLN